MKLKLFAAAAVLTLVTVAPTLADEYPVHRRHHYRHYHVSYWPLPYQISYLHNYGPGPVPGTFAFYDGPTSRLCKQSAAAYIGQDGRRYPCF
jgi:hypothetical protein